MHCLQRETRPLAVSVLRWNWEESFLNLHLVQTCDEMHGTSFTRHLERGSWNELNCHTDGRYSCYCF